MDTARVASYDNKHFQPVKWDFNSVNSLTLDKRGVATRRNGMQTHPLRKVILPYFKFVDDPPLSYATGRPETQSMGIALWNVTAVRAIALGGIKR